MKKLIVILGSVILISSCIKKQDSNNNFEQQIQLVGKTELNTQIQNFILDFMKSLKNPDCIYEIYIDKKTEDEYFLTLFNEPQKENYLTGRFPVNYTIINSKYIFIYSGIEDFISKKNFNSNIKIKDTINNDKFEASTISMVILKDTSYIAGEFGIPFSNIKALPPIKFKAPEK